MSHTEGVAWIEFGSPHLSEEDSVYGIYVGDIKIVETDMGFYPPRKEDAEYLIESWNGYKILRHVIEVILDADNDCLKDGLFRKLSDEARSLLGSGLKKAKETVAPVVNP